MKLSKLLHNLSLAIVFATSLQGALLVQQNKASAAAYESTLYTDQYLTPGNYLISNNGLYTAQMQYDGNFVVYYGSFPIWATNTSPNTVRWIYMQYDCNLVLSNASSRGIWASETSNAGNGCRLVMQDDGNLVIYRGDNYPIWSSRGGRGY